MGCGGYVGGKPALEHYEEGLDTYFFCLHFLVINLKYFLGFFGEPSTTTWVRGEPAEVAWYSGAHHRGGYAYRLCKVNNGKIWEVTEECFQKGHLNFYGKKST